MGFTTQIFTFFFLPACLLLYYTVTVLESKGLLLNIVKKFRLKDIVLILFSMGFYAWACFDSVLRLCVYILAVYGMGVWIERSRRKGRYLQVYEQKNDTDEIAAGGRIKLVKIPLLIAAAGMLLCLIYMKYTDFLIQLWNFLIGGSTEPKSVIALLGISFITFSAISYVVDIYRGIASSGSLIDCVLYLSFFPKVVSGPIVLWRDFQPQIAERTITLDKSIEGVNHIMIGFAKKLILADQFGVCISKVPIEGIDAITAWGTVLLYMLQIYFDFAGYSDVAIGVAQMLGFDIKKNFDFPYRSVSISEFWRRWHISLGTWFRQYVYFPLGGSRKGQRKTLRNLAVVFALTGIWHGAGWNYIIWGAVNGGCVLLERVIQDRKFYKKTPNLIKWFGTMFITMMCWQFFRFGDLNSVSEWVKIMLGITRFEIIPYTWQYYFDMQIVFLAVVGILGSTVLGDDRLKNLYGRFSLTKVGFVVQEFVLFLLFAVSILFMVNSTYSPFIYFQY